jgi:hypothetical protein
VADVLPLVQDNLLLELGDLMPVRVDS